MSSYKAEFTNIKGVNYLIEIETEKGSNNGTFSLSGDPLNSSMDSDGKTLYAPIKCSGMTVSILTKDMPFDLYSGSALGTKVNVKENDKYIFKGYLTPCAYSMGYDAEIEEIQLECVDGISALKEIPYTSSAKEITPFINIIFNCLKKCNCYKTLYVTNNMQFSQNLNEAIFEKIRVSESNFFDEKDYEMQPDNEVAWTCYDVLFEIMQYLGCTMIADGEDVYIVDYDAIRNGKNKYFKYNISGSTIGTKQEVTLSQSYYIKEGSYAENGSKVDLTETFNKQTVKDDFFTLESLIEGIDESKNYTNVTSPTDTTLINQWSEHKKNNFRECGVFTRKNKNNEDESFFLLIMKNREKDGHLFIVYGKFFTHPMITTYKYYDTTNTRYKSQTTKFSDLYTDAKGSHIVGYFTKKIESSTYNSVRAQYDANFSSLPDETKLQFFAQMMGAADVSNKQLINYILCLNYDAKHIEHGNSYDYPYFTIKKDIPSIFGGNDAYIVIGGSLIRHHYDVVPFPMNGDCYCHKDEKKTSFYEGEGYNWARLKWGNKYWKNEGSYKEQGEWVNDPDAKFKLFYADATKEQNTSVWLDKEVKIYNTCSTVWGVNGEDGYYIPAPQGENLTGTIEFTVFANKDTKGKWARNNKGDKKNSYSGKPPKVMLWKSLDIKVGFEDEALNEDAASADTIYTNEVTNYPNIKEGEEIECKICTFDSKTPSFSTTDYLVNGKSQYVDTLFNQGTNIALRPEEHIIYKIVNQYQEPKVIYTSNIKNDVDIKPYILFTDKTLSGRNFILDTIQRNYRYNSAEVSIIEKNNKYK